MTHTKLFSQFEHQVKMFSTKVAELKNSIDTDVQIQEGSLSDQRRTQRCWARRLTSSPRRCRTRRDT